MAARRWIRFLMHLFMWGMIIAYVCVASSHCNRKRDALLCRGLKVTVIDSAERGFITPAMVKAWFVKDGIKFRDQELYKINTAEIKDYIANRGFVKKVRVYVTSDGYVNVELSQREPFMRVQREGGESFYVTDDWYVLPVQRHFVAYVPVVTGNFTLPFKDGYVGYVDDCMSDKEKKLSKNYMFFCKLINFVKFVYSDSFWRAQIVQINVASEGDGKAYEAYSEGLMGRVPECLGNERADVRKVNPLSESLDYQVEIVPRAGDQIVMIGSLDGYREKLDKLAAFYKNAVRYVGWENIGRINLKYEGQIVCTQQ